MLLCNFCIYHLVLIIKQLHLKSNFLTWRYHNLAVVIILNFLIRRPLIFRHFYVVRVLLLIKFSSVKWYTKLLIISISSEIHAPSYNFICKFYWFTFLILTTLNTLQGKKLCFLINQFHLRVINLDLGGILCLVISIHLRCVVYELDTWVMFIVLHIHTMSLNRSSSSLSIILLKNIST